MGTIKLLGNDLERDPGLETSILISLFSDQRADDFDTLPDASGNKRGWWADETDDKIGSKLWLLMRTATTPDVPDRAETYIKDALDWMIKDGLAKSIDVNVERSGQETLLMSIQIIQPDGQDQFYKYSFNWEAEILKRG